MPYRVTLARIPLGYALSSARSGENVRVCGREFLSSSDGDLLIDQLDGFVSPLLANLAPDRSMRPCHIDHLLAIIRRDKTAVVYINELNILADVQSKCSKAAGEACFAGDIADVLRVRFQHVEIPREAGVLFMFSVEWRRGLFFDFVPLGPDQAERDYDIERLLGQYYAFLLFENVHRITEEDWGRLLAQGWFPFVSLSPRTVDRMLAYIRAGWSVDDLLPQIRADVVRGLDTTLGAWRSNPVFAPHLLLLEQAVARYRDEDYISSTAIIYPRIEGLLRTHLSFTGRDSKPSQRNLVGAATEAAPIPRHEFSPLLPGRLRQYLWDVYFADFDATDPRGLSRHTVSHGVAPAQEFTAKTATTGILLLEHLGYLLRPVSKPATSG